jgi:hypothetical protein
MHLVAIAWIYVALMMAAAEATSPNGSVLGAVFTFLGYGVAPLAIVMYVFGAPRRRRTRRAREAAERAAVTTPSAPLQPDGGDHAAGDAVAAEREEP